MGGYRCYEAPVTAASGREAMHHVWARVMHVVPKIPEGVLCVQDGEDAEGERRVDYRDHLAGCEAMLAAADARSFPPAGTDLAWHVQADRLVAEAPWSGAEWAVALRFDNPRATALISAVRVTPP